MDKETIVKLAQPVATTLLALSIVTLPFLAKAADTMYIEGASRYMTPIRVIHANSCAD